MFSITLFTHFSSMRPNLLFSIFCCTLLICSCRAPISRERTAEIMVEMYMFDQKAQDYPELHRIADTTMAYTAILHKHGYSVNDFNRSLAYHLQKPEKFKKALIPLRDQILNQRNALQNEMDEELKRLEREKDTLFHFKLFRPAFPSFNLLVDTLDTWCIDSLKWWRADTTRTKAFSVIPDPPQPDTTTSTTSTSPIIPALSTAPPTSTIAPKRIKNRIP